MCYSIGSTGPLDQLSAKQGETALRILLLITPYHSAEEITVRFPDCQVDVVNEWSEFRDKLENADVHYDMVIMRDYTDALAVNLHYRMTDGEFTATALKAAGFCR